MWCFFIFISIMVIGVCGLLNYAVLKTQRATKFDVYLCSSITTLAVITLLAMWITELTPTPSALDVYRGNTELEITSVNGIPTDTVVVFKNK